MEPVSYDTSSPVISIFPYPGLVVPLGCRLLINMKEAGGRGRNVGMTCISGSGMDFAEPVVVTEEETKDSRWSNGDGWA